MPQEVARFRGCDHKTDDELVQWVRLGSPNAREQLGKGEHRQAPDLVMRWRADCEVHGPRDAQLAADLPDNAEVFGAAAVFYAKSQGRSWFESPGGRKQTVRP